MDIWEAIKKNEVAEIEGLIKSHADLNLKDKDGMTPLMVAVDYDNALIVQSLIKAKVKLDEVDKYGQTALMPAAGKGNMQFVKLLLVSRPGNILPIFGKLGILRAGEVHATRKAEACA
jgi:ankyrin repeat protein